MRAESANGDYLFRMSRQVNTEGRSCSERSIEFDRAVMVFDDLVADRESQPCALAYFFRGEERFEDASAVGFLDPAAGVADRNADTVGAFIALRRNVELASRGHAIGGIVRKVENDLGDLVFIHPGPRYPAVEFRMDTYALHFEVVLDQ